MQLKKVVWLDLDHLDYLFIINTMKITWTATTQQHKQIDK